MTTSLSISLSPNPKSRHLSLSRTSPLYPPTLNILNRRSFRLPQNHSRFRVIRASSVGGVNVPSTLKPGSVVESDKLPTDVRKRAMEAIDGTGGRVTIGDVSSKAGLNLNQAQKALQALASDTDGFLEVSNDGDVLYVFPKDYRSKLLAKSLKMKIEPWAEKAKSSAGYLLRVSFGTALVASIILVYTAIITIIASGGSEEDNRKRRGGRSYGSGVNFYINPIDLFRLWDTGYRRRPGQDNNEGLNFIESVFSVVFGDGNPNQGIEEERWKLLGEYIASNGGVVTAEELAPYLDVEMKDKGDESYILPVLLRFDGQPDIDEEGNILYRFPSLQRTASSKGTRRKEYVGIRWSNLEGKIKKFFEENKWQFSKTSVSERAMVMGLGALNLFGVFILSTMIKDMPKLPSGLISFVGGLLPVLQVYAGSFFAIPLVRWFFVSKTNAEIEKRNQSRIQRAQVLEFPEPSLKRKLLSARDMAERTVISKDKIIYSTEKDFDAQDYEAREWEKRFQELESSD